MTKICLALVVSLTALGGCIEVQRAANPNGAQPADEHTFGPIVTGEDVEGSGNSPTSDQSAQDEHVDGDGHEHDDDQTPEPNEGDEVVDDPPATDQGGPPELSDALVEVTTDSGLTYIDIEEGEGEHAANGDLIQAHYTGWLESDGTKFDSSLDRDTPFEFTLGQGQVIAGWDEGFLDMHAGSKRRLIIPADLGYGDQGQPGGGIPPGATLIFDVEILAINP